MGRPAMQHCGVLGMALLPSWRGRGLGERLLRERCGCAPGLYRTVGFEVEGRKRSTLLVDAAFQDLILMALLFDADLPASARHP